MAVSNGRNSEMPSSITTKQGIGMGCVAFSDLIQLKSLSTKCETQKSYGNGVIFTKKCGDNTVDLHGWTTVPAGRN